MSNPTYKAVATAAERTLQEGGYTSQAKPCSGKVLVTAIEDMIRRGELDVDITRSTIAVYVSWAANTDEGSKIVSGGPRGGYWYDASIQPKEAEIEETTLENTSAGTRVSVSEKDLYPLVSLWLQTKGYQASDVSTIKKGGKWGNPDIVGINRVELFGAVEIELASCEVKTGDARWEEFIFEAISHKRFSNRSWFVYRVKAAEEALPKGMDYYAERYKVGVVQIVLNDEEFAAVKAANAEALADYLDTVVERLPALYEHVPLQEKKLLCDRANVSLTFAYTTR